MLSLKFTELKNITIKYTIWFIIKTILLLTLSALALVISGYFSLQKDNIASSQAPDGCIKILGQTSTFDTVVNGIANMGQIEFTDTLAPAVNADIKACVEKVNDNRYDIKGWARNTNLGWISFYCGADGKNLGIDCGADTYESYIDGSGNFHGFAYGSGFGWLNFENINPPQANTVKVELSDPDTIGDVTGYAWSPNVGWFNFQGVNIPWLSVDPILPDEISIVINQTNDNDGDGDDDGGNSGNGYDLDDVVIADGIDKAELIIAMNYNGSIIDPSTLDQTVTATPTWTDTLKIDQLAEVESNIISTVTVTYYNMNFMPKSAKLEFSNDGALWTDSITLPNTTPATVTVNNIDAAYMRYTATDKKQYPPYPPALKEISINDSTVLPIRVIGGPTYHVNFPIQNVFDNNLSTFWQGSYDTNTWNLTAQYSNPTNFSSNIAGAVKKPLNSLGLITNKFIANKGFVSNISSIAPTSGSNALSLNKLDITITDNITGLVTNYPININNGSITFIPAVEISTIKSLSEDGTAKDYILAERNKMAKLEITPIKNSLQNFANDSDINFDFELILDGSDSFNSFFNDGEYPDYKFYFDADNNGIVNTESQTDEATGKFSAIPQELNTITKTLADLDTNPILQAIPYYPPEHTVQPDEIPTPELTSIINYPATDNLGQQVTVKYYSKELKSGEVQNPAAEIKGNVVSQEGILDIQELKGVAGESINARDVFYKNASKFKPANLLEQDNVKILPNGLNEKDGTDHTFLDGQIIYNIGDAIIETGDTSSSDKDKTIIADSGNVFIDSNLTQDKNLGIMAFDNLASPEQEGNIYICKDVTDIIANFYADGSIFTYDCNPLNIDVNGIPIINPSFALSNQLYIRGVIVSGLNTIGGAFRSPVIFGDGTTMNNPDSFKFVDKVYEDDPNRSGFYSSTQQAALELAKQYDLNYLREMNYSVSYDGSGLAIDLNGTPDIQADKPFDGGCGGDLIKKDNLAKLSTQSGDVCNISPVIIDYNPVPPTHPGFEALSGLQTQSLR